MATIRKRENGTWQAVVRRNGYPSQSKVFDRHVDAEDWAREVERDIRRGEYKDRRNANNTTLRQLLEYYRDHNAQENKGKSVDLIRLNVLLNSNLAKYSMAALTHDLIESWCRQYIKNSVVKGSTIIRYLNLLSAVINVGIKKKKLSIDNPVTLVDRPPQPRHRDRRLSNGEEEYLLRALTPTERDERGHFTGPRNIWLQPVVEFAIETAMRRSEILGLEWCHVNMERGIAHIPDTKPGKGEEAPVPRDVPLTAKALEILESLSRDSSGKVFPVSADAIKKAFSRAVKRARKAYDENCKKDGKTPLAKFLVDLHFHDLRHEGTSRMAKFYDIRQLAKVGGWTNLNTLAKYYNPTTDELIDRMRQHESTAKI